MRTPLLNADGLVVNVVLAGDGWTPPDGLTIGAPGGDIGDKWNGVEYVKPSFTDGRTLAQIKSDLCAKVDSAAEAIRANHSTAHASLAMTYQEKFAQANAVDSMGQDAANALTSDQVVLSFPILAASVGVEAATLWDAAQKVIAKYQEWSQLSASIERVRLIAKRDINAANTVGAAQAVYEAITWPT